MYIKRKLEDKILQYLPEKEILAIVGPRQSGKTTLLKKIQESLKDSIFLTFEDIETLELFEKDIKGFIKRYQDFKYIFVDEFQYAKAGGKNLKYLFDTFPGLKIIISGSSAIDLTVKAIKFLVGRIFVMELYQLDFSEYLSHSDPELFKIFSRATKNFSLVRNELNVEEVDPEVKRRLNYRLNEFIIWGGYPRVATAANEELKKEILKNIYNTYFLRDIRDTLGLVDDFRLSKLIELLSAESGQLVDYNELSKLSGYDFRTLKKYINILEKTFICRTVRPYYKNRRTEIIKNPKIYFFDTGLRNYSLGDFNELANRKDKGSLYENFIFNQLLKSGVAANYWRNKSKVEVDFIIRQADQILPIEVKSDMKDNNLPPSLKTFLNLYECKQSIVANVNLIDVRKSDDVGKIYFLPHWVF